MSQKHRHSNREVKKPKQPKKTATPTVAPAFGKGFDPASGLTAKKKA